MSEKKTAGKTKGRALSFVFFSALAVALHCLLLLGAAELVRRGSISDGHGTAANMLCGFLGCLTASVLMSRGEGRGTIRTALMLSLGYCLWLTLLSALGNGRIMDNNVTLRIWGCGALGSLTGAVTKLCKSNKSYRNGIKRNKNNTFRYHA